MEAGAGREGQLCRNGSPGATSMSRFPFAFSTEPSILTKDTLLISVEFHMPPCSFDRVPWQFSWSSQSSFHHALTFPQHTKNALGQHTEWRKSALNKCLLSMRKFGWVNTERYLPGKHRTRNQPTSNSRVDRTCWFGKGTWPAKKINSCKGS